VGSLGGTVELETEPGQGTTFRFRLPVSLATAEAVWVGLGEESYAVPLTHVVEALELADGATRKGGRLRSRGKSYPAVDLAEALEVTGARAGAALLVDVGGREAALVVDRLLGREQVVVRELHAPRGAHPMLAGVTLRGDGRPALVLDPAAVV
jgi:two-component system chemotaxis sensor kinase CheA